MKSKAVKTQEADDPFQVQARAVEQERCEADLMYEIFMHPSRPISLKDPSTGQVTETTLIDRMLGAGAELIAKKYSPDYGKSRMITDSAAFLQSKSADPVIKLFNFLFILAKEPEIQKLILSAYVIDHPGNLWGANADIHFESFVKAVDCMVEKTLKWPCNELNIVEVVRNMVHAAKMVYLTT